MVHPRDEIVRTLKTATNVLVITHIHPDGDALGSQIAMGNVLRSLGKNVFLYGEEPVSHLYRFLPGSTQVESVLPDVSGFDCAVALDCGDCSRLGTSMESLLAVHPFVVIDHHTGHKDFGDLRWIAPDRASTGEMVYDLSESLGAELSFETAYCLYAAIVSDTGSFKYSSTTADTFRIAGELLKKGVKPAEVSGKLFDNFTVKRLNLMRLVLDSLQLYASDRLAIIEAPRDFFVKTGTCQADAETFINYPRSLDTVKVAAFIKETESGLVSVSLRSKGTDYDVAQVAASFGGGGHRNAAGLKLGETSIAEVREKLLVKLLPLVTR
ncbi:MAG: bifunctional oligoribonuclease/PAP phosphatase NrnA [Proteobacteria bacterium]|nr:bifunctional oligoribonuclease/PAP phosphatase NrnA [Pseudomonadota bacterium]